MFTRRGVFKLGGIDEVANFAWYPTVVEEISEMGFLILNVIRKRTISKVEDVLFKRKR